MKTFIDFVFEDDIISLQVRIKDAETAEEIELLTKKLKDIQSLKNKQYK